MIILHQRLSDIVVWGFISLAIIYSLFTLSRILTTFYLQDFSLYYQGAQSVLMQKNPYTQVQGVIYPPIALILLTPFSALPYSLAEDTWTVLSFVSLVLSIILLSKSTTDSPSLKMFLLVLSMAMLSFPVKFTLGMGQINLFLLLLVCASFYSYRKNHFVTAGIALSVAAALKLTPLVLLLFFIKKRQWKVVLTFVMSFAVLNGAGYILLGSSVTSDFWRTIFPAIPTIGNAVYYNQALTGWLARALVSEQLSVALNYLAFGGMLVLSWISTKTTKQSSETELGELGLLAISTLVGTGLAWQHHYVSMLLPFFALLMMTQRFKEVKIGQLVAILIAYVLIASNFKNPSFSEEILQYVVSSHVLFGALTTFSVLIWTLRQTRQ